MGPGSRGWGWGAPALAWMTLLPVTQVPWEKFLGGVGLASHLHGNSSKRTTHGWAGLGVSGR